ncbi:MAG TPA: D-glycero-beta-D-manno-heptose-7-phosphate kinase [Rhizomicrobium sp.]
MSIVEQFPDARILCVGDVMVDRFEYGSIARISPESPVPVLLTGKSQSCPGGAANVARNIAALGGHCSLLSVVGDDEAGRVLKADLAEVDNIRAAFVTSSQRRTTEKRRFVAQGQQVLRVDSEDTGAISPEDSERLMALISEQMNGHNVLVLSDYAKGVLTDAIVHHAIKLARDKGLQIVVDPKSRDLARYRGANVITPNAREVAASTGIEPTGDDAAADAARQAMEQPGIDAVLLTRAEKGMTLVQRGKAPVHIASDVREVFDVAGAGDTVVATLALALGAGGDLVAAARLANLAAGIAVGRRGTSTVSQSDLLDALSARAGSGAAKVLNLANLKTRVETWKHDGLKVGFTNGCFDILHLGHIRLLEFSKNHCDRLIVALNSDASVRRLKGAGRPINGETDRAEILAALAMADAVIVFDQDTPQDVIEAIAPDVLVKGADYAIEQIVGAEFVTARGGAVLRFALVPDKSSTNVLKKAGVERI